MRLMLIFLLICPILLAQNPNDFFDRADTFLASAVIEGRVRYDYVRQNPQQLRKLQTLIAEIPAAALKEPEAKKAFRINAYNISVIAGIVDHDPAESPMDIPGFFDRLKFRIAGENLTLNQLEHKRLFAEEEDARLHFVLVCAAVSCPVIINQAYRPEKLSDQLEERTRISINSDRHVRYLAETSTLKLSEIFSWYAQHFGKNDREVLQFINRYRSSAVPENAKIEYVAYDWRINAAPSANGEVLPGKPDLRAYTPSTLLRHGEIEIKQFNNLYSQTAFFDQQRNKIEESRRSSYFTAINSFLYGYSRHLNIGADLYFRSVRIDAASASPFAALQFGNDNLSRTALAQIAPRLKFTPLPQLGSLALQATLMIPIADDLEGQSGDHPFLDYDVLQWWTQVFYDRSISRRFLLYFEAGAFVRFGDETTLFTPFKSIVNFYPADRWTIYLPLEVAPTWEGSSWNSWYSQAGVGLKFQLSGSFEVEGLLTNFPMGRNSGAGNTFNMGFRIIR